MKVTTTKTMQSTDKATRSPEEQRFDKAWQQVIEQQKDNENYREHIRTFVKETSNRLEAKEKECMDTMYKSSLHLLGFLSRKSLTRWQRETLLAWVGQYLFTMQSNPFSSHLDFGPITQSLNEAYEAYEALHPPLYEDLGDESSFLDNFEDSDEGSKGSESFFEEFFEEFFKHQQEEAEQQHHEEKLALKQLMKSSSINRLFRKIAAILHPDKETNEALREEKNTLMSELIQARNTNDIPRIFDFYAKYVGHSPLQELGEDLESASELLERQHRDLLRTKENILHDDPLAGILHHHFHKKTPAATTRAINKHLKGLEEQHNNLQIICRDITSLNKLKPYLELHYDMLFQKREKDYFF